MVLGITLAPGGQAAEEGDAREKLRLEVSDQRLSVEIGNIGLGDALREIGRRAGFEIEIRGNLGQVRAQAFNEVSLDEGIRRLVGDNRVNLIMRYEAVDTGELRLVEVVARAAGEVQAELLEQRRMRVELSRVRIPLPPPPPRAQ